MVFTIEPMINMGAQEIYTDEEDDWTVYTADGKPSAQYEIQVLVTEDGYEILSYQDVNVKSYPDSNLCY